MSKLIEMFVMLTKEEEEILMHEYKDAGAMRFAISRLLNKEISKHCELLTMSEKWLCRNSIIENDEGEAS